MARFSITRRLIASVLLTELILTCAVVAFAGYLTRVQLLGAFDAALRGRAMGLAALVRFSEDGRHSIVLDSRSLPPPLGRERADYFRVLDDSGEVIAASPPPMPGWVLDPDPHRAYWDLRSGDEEYRVTRLRVPVPDQGDEEAAISRQAMITVLYAASTEEVRERAWWASVMTAAGAVLLLLISTLLTVWAVRKGLLPLTELAGAAGRITHQSWVLDVSPQARSTRELAPLTAAMDAMLARLRQAFASQRDFVANAAHELKTPVAVLKSTLQLALQRERSADDYRTGLRQALEDTERIEALTHSLLRLARIEQVGPHADLPLVTVAGSCEASAERLRPIAEAKWVRVEVVAEEDPMVRADPDDLELVWNNLVENAIRYSPPQETVLVRITTALGQVQVTVEDRGPGIPPAEIERIFTRFHRADASRSRETGGYGLGLAICKAMVEAYGGAIHAESRVGFGTRMKVTIPAAG